MGSLFASCCGGSDSQNDYQAADRVIINFN